MKDKSIKLSTIMKVIVEDAVKQSLYNRALTEKDKQDAVAKSITPDVKGDDDAAAAAEPQPSTTSKTMEYDVDALKSGEVTVDDIVDKLNSIRSGHSFRDDDVKANMQQYIDSLSTAEKTALLAFLHGISQIVTGMIPGPQAIDPSSKPANVKMSKDTGEPEVRHVKPNVIKTDIPKVKKGPSAEDTSAPVPITPKKKQ